MLQESIKGINTCYPGRIVSFDPSTQTATIQLMIEKVYSNLGGRWIFKDSAPLVNVPCHFPKGGGHSITMPVVKGDDCLVMFAQRGYAHWLYEGTDKAGNLEGRPAPEHRRRFSKSDALALIGFGSGIEASVPNTITDFNIGAIEIRNVDRTQRVSLHVDSKDIDIVTDTNVLVDAGGNVTALAGGNIEATAEGNATVTASAITLNASGNINIVAGGTLNLSGASVNIN